ncbi:MAG: hypothetical protein AVDCRST_MAG83-1328, partial [uncultured Arthrobacter sp.]
GESKRRRILAQRASSLRSAGLARTAAGTSEERPGFHRAGWAAGGGAVDRLGAVHPHLAGLLRLGRVRHDVPVPPGTDPLRRLLRLQHRPPSAENAGADPRRTSGRVPHRRHPLRADLPGDPRTHLRPRPARPPRPGPRHRPRPHL